ncbi:MAG: DNA polymerase I 5'-3' exonuclease domain [uncultured Nocardioidaceae bacterium]|uniref:5'-3' exonuclease n=1 Tax=uncultured Nocardioidaceae bacterium TaxID=253824 RepID=A0A6J4MVJ0_9ACTN|nr:MAG: DNA polymerase I 5'-3' exonuclease domain [uncultured Nocardioidaceae bacterium]
MPRDIITRVTTRLMLLDTASLYFRAYFGVPDSVQAPDGTPVNAVRGLLDFISRLVSTYEPTDLVCCWDDDWRPAWRVDLIPSYKAHRVVAARPAGVDVEVTPDPLETQVPIIRKVLGALGVAVLGARDYEADDIIGTLTARATGPVDIVTGDRDLFQLVSDDRQVRVLYTARGVGNLEVVTDGVVARKYGVLPEQYVDFAVLRGDPSDGLPGVKGIGDKTAAGLLQQYGDLSGIRDVALDPTSGLGASLRGKLVDASDYLDVAPMVVQVACDVELDKVPTKIGDLDVEARAAVEALAETWGLGSAAQRVMAALDPAKPAADVSADSRGGVST